MENNKITELKERETYTYWEQQLDDVRKKNEEYKHYLKTAKLILDRYNNRKSEDKNDIISITEYGNSKICNDGYNLTFKITETILPFLIPYIPEIVVERQNKDKDIVGNLASRVLERCLNNFAKESCFKEIMSSTTRDAWLQGQGIAWFGKKETIKQSETQEQFIDENGQTILGEVKIEEQIDNQEVLIDFVAPEDFFHNTARNEKELEWVARRVFLSKEDFTAQFENQEVDNYINKDGKDKNKVIVYEIWDKADKKIRYFADKKRAGNETINDLLKSEDYPEGFDFDFPCENLQFIKKTNSLIPTPILDNIMYLQDLIDNQTRKIKTINDQLQIKGVYDKAIGELEKALSSNNNNKLYPIDFQKDGSIQNSIMFFPLTEITNALNTNILARQNNIDKAMELIGDNPILEGITNSQEAYGTNRMKGSFGTMRVQEYQKYKVEFLDKVLNKIGTIFCSFDEYFLIEYSNIKFDLTEEEQLQLAPAIQLLKDEKMRKCRLLIETDSTKAYYDESYRMQLNEFFNSLINNLNQSATILQSVPAFAGVLKAIIMANVRSQRIGRSFETDIEKAIDESINQLMQQKAQPQDDGKSTEIMAKVQADLQKANITAQQKDKELQTKNQIAIMQEQNENQRHQQTLQKDYRQQDIEKQIADAKAILDVEKIQLAREELAMEAQLEMNGIKANIGTSLA